MVYGHVYLGTLSRRGGCSRVVIRGQGRRRSNIRVDALQAEPIALATFELHELKSHVLAGRYLPGFILNYLLNFIFSSLFTC